MTFSLQKRRKHARVSPHLFFLLHISQVHLQNVRKNLIVDWAGLILVKVEAGYAAEKGQQSCDFQKKTLCQGVAALVMERES